MSAAVDVRDGGEYLTFHRAGLTFAAETPYPVWTAAVRRLTEAGGSVQWWIGDALNYGERRYGEMYAQAVEGTAFEYQALANMKWVASRCERSTRVENLSWSHHRLVASLGSDEQARWLGDAAKGEWTVARMKSAMQAAALGQESAPRDDPPQPPFGVILADPPWQYEQRSVRLSGTTERHYDAMSTPAIAGLRIAEVAAADSILLLWTTWPFLADALQVIGAWGFRYVTGLPWVKADAIGTDFDGTVQFKPNKGVGFWFRGATEPLLMAKRGAPARAASPCDGILSDRNIHSRKPTLVYDLAQSFDGPYLEVFARSRRAGWASVGDGVDGRDVRESLRDLRG